MWGWVGGGWLGGAAGEVVGHKPGFVVARFGDGRIDQPGECRSVGERVVSETFGVRGGFERDIGGKVGSRESEHDEACGVLAVGEGGAQSGARGGVGEEKTGVRGAARNLSHAERAVAASASPTA